LAKDRISNATQLNNVFRIGQWTFPEGGITSVMMNSLGVWNQFSKKLGKGKKYLPAKLSSAITVSVKMASWNQRKT
jgi:hypothetical protein